MNLLKIKAKKREKTKKKSYFQIGSYEIYWINFNARHTTQNFYIKNERGKKSRFLTTGNDMNISNTKGKPFKVLLMQMKKILLLKSFILLWGVVKNFASNFLKVNICKAYPLLSLFERKLTANLLSHSHWVIHIKNSLSLPCFIDLIDF